MSRSISATDDMIIAKYDTSGTIQWQRSIRSTGYDTLYSISVDTAGSIYVCGYSTVSSITSTFIAHLPTDGSKTGTYSVGGYSFTYAASSLTDSSTSLTDSVSTLADAATTLTDAGTTLAYATTTQTSSVTII